ncbi:MAG: mechanosensitive ion channel [Kiritimatiellae bacterium]|nr:mechanosensitive ion channel [Kiritimatiellia bacterium]
MNTRKSLRGWVAIGVALGIASVTIAQETAPEESRGVVQAGRDAAVATWETGKDVAVGVGDATKEVGQALQGGTTGMVEQGQKLWKEAVIPMFQRLAAALPGLIKAILVLLGFWVIARLAGAGVTKLLGMTQVDNKAAKEWGLGGVMEGEKGEKRSIEKMAGGLVKWVILLFGFVAFFNALSLQMVAGPLQNILDKIVGVVPNLLKAAVILLGYWVVGTLLRMGVSRGLKALKFDERAGKYLQPDETKSNATSPSSAAGNLLFYLVLLFGIPPFLQALGQEALVGPLQDMLSKTLSFLPNIVAATIILLIGMLVAKIVRNVVSNLLAAAGINTSADRIGIGKILGDKKASDVIGTIIHVFIIIPIIVSAVDSLQIKAISDPLTGTLERILAAVPAILVATVIVLIGVYLAKMVRKVVETFLSGAGFDGLPERIGLAYLSPKKSGATLSTIVGAAVQIVILLLTAQQALDSLKLQQLSLMVGGIVQYLPRLVVGVIILLTALSLGGYVGGLVKKATQGARHEALASNIAKYAVIFLGASMSLSQLGVGEDIVRAAVTAVLGGTALALGLAFGLGGKDKAKQIIEKN